jgi:hypothetical protein
MPVGQSAELDHRGGDLGRGEHLGGEPGPHRSVTAHLDDRVGVLDHPLESMLGQDHGDPEIMNQPGDGGQDLLGGGRVESGRRFVEDQDARMGGQHRADGHSLLLTTGQLIEGSTAQVGDAEEVERLLHPLAHDVRGDGQLLHGVGELLFHRVRDEPGQRILTHHADGIGQLARWIGPRVAAVDGDPTR